jgi:threonine aldolase
LIALENTHNRCGGAALSVEYTQKVAELAHEYGLGVHLDGARVFNAAAALGVTAAELCAPVDTVTFCLSKGLCAPVGSVLCGSRAFIHQARRIRKQLGGGMRQAGIIAAAGIVALEQMVDRLAEDHRLARRLAEKLSRVQGIRIESPPATNMVYLSLEDSIPLTADQVAARMTKLGVRVGVVGERRFRLVTHYWINAKGVEQAVQAFEEILAVV